MSITRRDLLESVCGSLASPLLLSRSDAQVTPDVLKFSGELEPLVALIERTPFAPQVFDQQTDAGAQRLDSIFVGKDQELFLQFASALWCDDSALEQQCP